MVFLINYFYLKLLTCECSLTMGFEADARQTLLHLNVDQDWLHVLFFMDLALSFISQFLSPLHKA